MKTEHCSPATNKFVSTNDVCESADVRMNTVSQVLKRNQCSSRSLYAAQSFVAVRTSKPGSRTVLRDMLSIDGLPRKPPESDPSQMSGKHWFSRVRHVGKQS